MTGSINPVAELTRMARDAGALVYVDAVQLVPHSKTEVSQLDCDFLACSAYKFLWAASRGVMGKSQSVGRPLPLRSALRPAGFAGAA